MTHSLPYDVNCSILFTELPLLERPAAVARAGFDAVEFWWPFAAAVPSEKDVEKLIRAIRDAGVRLVALNFAAGDMAAGDRGLASLPPRTSEFRDNVDVAVGIGEVLGCATFNALYGNRTEGLDPRHQDEVGVENLALAAKAAGRIGGTVMIEPLSGIETYPLVNAADALSVIRRVRKLSEGAAVGLLADLYHLAVNGDDVDSVITNHVRDIAHVQIADHPGRGQPGTGRLPIERYLQALQSAGYAAWVGLEYRPSDTSLESLGWLPHGRRGASPEAASTARGLS